MFASSHIVFSIFSSICPLCPNELDFVRVLTPQYKQNFDVILYNIMDKKSQTTKYSLKNLRSPYTQKTKNHKNSTARTPKNLDNTVQHKSTFLNRYSSNPSKTQRQMVRSALPLDIPHPQIENQPKVKHYRSNISNNDLMQSNSEKTVKVKIETKGKQKGKLSKKEKQAKLKKHHKTGFDRKKSKISTATRKNSIYATYYEQIINRTSKLLNEYKERQAHWERERMSLIEELEDLRQKTNSRALTTSASVYLHKKEYAY